jgi:ribosome-binding protein aMBF1 (putative translation factor)
MEFYDETSLLQDIHDEYYEWEEEREREEKEAQMKKQKEEKEAQEEKKKLILEKVGLDGYPKKMKLAREALNMTQKQLAKELKVERVDISAWESGKAPICPMLLYKIMMKK